MNETAAAHTPVYVGLMSGTSLDGISAAAVRFHSRAAGYDAELLAFVVHSYSPAQRDTLERAMSSGSARDYCQLQADVGHWMASAAVEVLADAGVPRRDVRAIGSHGQTLWHEPPHSTWQIGEPAVIAEQLGIDVVSDFRARDVSAGGQGAPLVPMADALLFASDQWRAFQNLGGIGNVAVVPPGGVLNGVRAFDTGPGVAVIDGVVRTLFPGQRFDRNGEHARAGAVVESVVRALLNDEYFVMEPPKSTGRELFGASYVARIIDMCRTTGPAVASDDIAATATALTARSIADAYRRFVPAPIGELLLSGGGAKNPALVGMISDALAPLAVRRFSDAYFDDEAKEAVAFALFAHLFIEHRAANIPYVTGASGPRILGKLTPA